MSCMYSSEERTAQNSQQFKWSSFQALFSNPFHCIYSQIDSKMCFCLDLHIHISPQMRKYIYCISVYIPPHTNFSFIKGKSKNKKKLKTCFSSSQLAGGPPVPFEHMVTCTETRHHQIGSPSFHTGRTR